MVAQPLAPLAEKEEPEAYTISRKDCYVHVYSYLSGKIIEEVVGVTPSWIGVRRGKRSRAYNTESGALSWVRRGGAGGR